MKESKLLSFLQRLSAWEMNHFIEFVNSPFFNKHHRVRRMAQYFAETHPEFLPDQVNKTVVGTYTFEGPFEEQALSDVMTYLTRLVEKFLAVRRFMADEFEPDFHLLKELGDRGMEKAWKKQWRRMQKKTYPPEPGFWHQRHLMESEQLQAEFRWGGRISGQHMYPLIHSLDTYYLTTRLRYACAHLNRQKLLKEKGPLPGMELILKLVNTIQEDSPSPGEGNISLLKVYRKIYHLLQYPDQHVSFAETQEYLMNHSQALSHANQKEVFAYLMNFCIQHINQGMHDYRQILFDLYIWQLDKGILLEEGYLSPWDVKNMVSLGLKMKAFDWVEQFLDGAEEQIKPEHRTQAITYNLAMLRYEQQRPREVMRLLRHTEFSDPFYQLGAKALLIKIYYEGLDLEALFSLLDTFEAYLKRPRLLSAYQRELYLNFVRLVRRLARFKGRIEGGYQLVKRQQLERLEERIRNQKAVAQQDWLRNKCKELLEIV